MRSEDVERLRGLEIFRGVQVRTFEKLVAPSFMQSFPAGTTLLEESQSADFLYIILEGFVEMSAQTDRYHTIIEILGPVNLFILAAVLNNDVCLQSAKTLTPARILMIPAGLVRELLWSDADFMTAVVFELGSAYRRTIKELKNQKLRGGAERLANWLIRENLRQGGTGRLTIPFEKRVLAAYLGMTAENLSRGFSVLAGYGVTNKSLNVALADPAALTAFAEPSPLIDEGEPQFHGTPFPQT